MVRGGFMGGSHGTEVVVQERIAFKVSAWSEVYVPSGLRRDGIPELAVLDKELRYDGKFELVRLVAIRFFQLFLAAVSDLLYLLLAALEAALVAADFLV